MPCSSVIFRQIAASFPRAKTGFAYIAHMHLRVWSSRACYFWRCKASSFTQEVSIFWPDTNRFPIGFSMISRQFPDLYPSGSTAFWHCGSPQVYYRLSQTTIIPYPGRTRTWDKGVPADQGRNQPATGEGPNSWENIWRRYSQPANNFTPPPKKKKKKKKKMTTPLITKGGGLSSNKGSINLILHVFSPRGGGPGPVPGFATIAWQRGSQLRRGYPSQ